MKQFFQATAVAEIRERLARLQLDSVRQWGTMPPAQMAAHCAGGIEMALGDLRPRRSLLGRVLGRVVKPLALGSDAPLRRSTPTSRELVIQDQGDLAFERERLNRLIDRFVAAGPPGCTSHPHAFFGRLRPDEWATLLYKHLDHHLRQFAV